MTLTGNIITTPVPQIRGLAILKKGILSYILMLPINYSQPMIVSISLVHVLLFQQPLRQPQQQTLPPS